MIALHLDHRGFLHIRKYDKKDSWFKTHCESINDYHILASDSLTQAFLHKNNLFFLIPLLCEGYCFLMPDLKYNKKDYPALRAYRYNNFEKLPYFYVKNKLPDIKNEQPLKVLVNFSNSFITLAAFQKYIKEKEVRALLNDFCRTPLFIEDNHIYFKGRLSDGIKALWIKRFSDRGLIAAIQELDEKISVLKHL